MPDEYFVYVFFQSLGELGLLANFAAILVGRPKTIHRGRVPHGGEERFVVEQRKAVLRALSEYAPAVPAVFGVDFGHTDPQLVCLPPLLALSPPSLMLVV